MLSKDIAYEDEPQKKDKSQQTRKIASRIFRGFQRERIFAHPLPSIRAPGCNRLKRRKLV